ncbi:MAG: TonB-dependent receptor, partial [Janthinobacterium sp.]
MASRQLLHVKARDGLTLPAWLTLPKGSGRQLPLVVLIHDGPWQRGDWGWDPASQFLASRGYAVLEPDYRGSTGLGARHFRAGWKQWGLAMQDDIADAARWAITEGIADPQRICLAGGGYGGYATLMGLGRDPALFRCGIAWSSIPDLRELKDEVNWWLDDDLRNSNEQYTLAMLLGAKALKPEKSKNLSLGFTWKTPAGFSGSVDVYDIQVSDRFSTSAAFAVPAGVANPLRYTSVSYFTNDFDTT